MRTIYFFSACFAFLSCNDEKSVPEPANLPPTVTLASELISVDPFTYQFSAAAEDPEKDDLVFRWDFGEGTVKEGGVEETFSFDDGGDFNVKVTVSDNVNTSTSVTSVTSKSTTITIDASITYQTMDGFGGAGPAIPFYFVPNPSRYDLGDGYFDEEWLELMVNDWGATIFRDAVSPAFEAFPGEFDEHEREPNWARDDNNQQISTSNYYHLGDETPRGPIGSSLSTKAKYAKALKAKIEENGEELKYVMAVWTPPAWMKTSGNHMKGSLQEEYFDEFADFLAKYVIKFEELSGVTPYALSIQNEPNLEHEEWTFGCSYTGENYRDLLKLVKGKFVEEGIENVKLFGPETVRFLYRMTNIMDPVFADPQAHSYIDIMATHSYAGDGITIESGTASEWEELYTFSQQKGEKPLWMTETESDGGWEGALTAGKRILAALKFGKVSAWMWWSVGAPDWETNTRNGFTHNGIPSGDRPKYWTSKNFYKYIRPGAVQIESSTDNDLFGVVAFQHASKKTTTIVSINDSEEERIMKLEDEGLPERFQVFETSQSVNCEWVDTMEADQNWFIMSPKSIYTILSISD